MDNIQNYLPFHFNDVSSPFWLIVLNIYVLICTAFAGFAVLALSVQVSLYIKQAFVWIWGLLFPRKTRHK